MKMWSYMIPLLLSFFFFLVLSLPSIENTESQGLDFISHHSFTAEQSVAFITRAQYILVDYNDRKNQVIKSSDLEPLYLSSIVLA